MGDHTADMDAASFQPAVWWIPERIKDLRINQPDLCWRPNAAWKNVCIKELGHAGPCGWEYASPEPKPSSLPWAVEQMLEAGRIVGLDPREMLLSALAQVDAETRSSDGTSHGD